MARMYPPQIDSDSPSSEKRVFNSLRDSTPAEWVALHSQRFILPGTGNDRAREGEVDFVVIDPERGWLGVEVKGGGIDKRGDQWTSTDRHGRVHEIHDPAKQAQGAAHALGKFIKDQKWFRERRISPSFGWVVVLTNHDIDGNPGLGLPRELLLGSTDLRRMHSALETAFEYHNLTGPALDHKAQDALVRILCPSFQLVPAMDWRLDEERQALVQLTEEQYEVLNMFQNSNRVAVNGPGGSGKTMLAMEKARRLADEGKRVLLLCYNRPLADHLARSAEGFTVKTFHLFCSEMARATGDKFIVPKDADKARQFWAEDAADKLMSALDIYPDERFDAVIVDEGQDFHELWWVAIEKLLADPEQSTLYVFYDPNQDLYGGGPGKTLGLMDAQLRVNCRNTKRIAEHSAAILGIDIAVKASAPDGMPVEVIDCADDKGIVDATRKQLHRLVSEEKIRLDKIVVMSPRAARSPVWNARTLGNVTLVEQEQVPAANQVRFVSLRRFKGLEADAVILCDVEEGTPYCSPNDLYVGTSRARHVLVIIRKAG